MSLPYADVVQAVRTAASHAGRLRVDRVAGSIGRASPMSSEPAAALFVRLALGVAPDPIAIREVTMEIDALADAPRSLACVLAPALSAATEDAIVIGRALHGIGAASSAALGAIVPTASVIDATLLQACRDAQWASERLTQKKGGSERAEELARRVARSLGVGIETAKQIESVELSAQRLQLLDVELAAQAARTAEIEAKLRASLPKV